MNICFQLVFFSTGGGNSTSTACHPNTDWMCTTQVIEVQSEVSIR